MYRDEAKQTQFGLLNVSSDWKEHVCRTLMMLKSPRPSSQPRLSYLFCRMFGIWGLELGVLYTSLQGQPVDRRSLLWLLEPPARYQLPWRDYSFSPHFPGCRQELRVTHWRSTNPKSAIHLISSVVLEYNIPHLQGWMELHLHLTHCKPVDPLKYYCIGTPFVCWHPWIWTSIKV